MPRRGLLTALVFTAAVAVPAEAPAAQAPGKTAALAGTVRDTLGHPIRMVAVLVEGTELSAVTDDSGRFHVKGIPAGPADFTVRRIGYSSVEFETTLQPDSTLVLEIRMKALQNLNTVTVTAERLKRLESTGFNERKRTGIGSYVTPERVDSLSSRVTSAAMLLRDVRGIELSCRVSYCRVITRRKPPLCLNVFVNGGFREGQLDDNVDLSEVYAIEVYERAVIVPSEFQGKLPMKNSLLSLRAGCGAIAVWTRGRAAP